jgi:hypothetical protein
LDLAAIQQYAPQYTDVVYAITVGSESLYRGNFTGATLIAKMNDVRAATGNAFRIGTADSWNKYADGTADAVIQGGADLLLVNAFGFWQGQGIDNATHTYFDDIMQAFGRIEKLAGGPGKIEVWTGETGWPTSESSLPNVHTMLISIQLMPSLTEPPSVAPKTPKPFGTKVFVEWLIGDTTSSSLKPLTSHGSQLALVSMAKLLTKHTGV